MRTTFLLPRCNSVCFQMFLYSNNERQWKEKIIWLIKRQPPHGWITEETVCSAFLRVSYVSPREAPSCIILILFLHSWPGIITAFPSPAVCLWDPPKYASPRWRHLKSCPWRCSHRSLLRWALYILLNYWKCEAAGDIPAMIHFRNFSPSGNHQKYLLHSDVAVGPTEVAQFTRCPTVSLYRTTRQTAGWFWHLKSSRGLNTSTGEASLKGLSKKIKLMIHNSCCCVKLKVTHSLLRRLCLLLTVNQQWLSG